MAAREMEAAQRAIRRTDYDSDDDDDDELITEVSLLPEATSTTSSSGSSSIRHRGGGGQGGRTTTTNGAQTPSFDPYDPSMPSDSNFSSSSINLNNTSSMDATNAKQNTSRESALADDSSVESITPKSTNNSFNNNIPTNANSNIPGGAGYLEMEGEPPRNQPPPLNFTNEPIKTTSGLLLTHRRHSPTSQRHTFHNNNNNNNNFNNNHYDSNRPSVAGGSFSTSHVDSIFEKSDLHSRNAAGFRTIQKDYFEVEHGGGWNRSSSSSSYSFNAPSWSHGNHSMHRLQARRFLSYVKIWMVLSAALLVLATGVLFHAFGHHGNDHLGTLPETVTSKNSVGATTDLETTSYQNAFDYSNQQQNYGVDTAAYDIPEQVILLPFENIAEFSKSRQREYGTPKRQLKGVLSQDHKQNHHQQHASDKHHFYDYQKNGHVEHQTHAHGPKEALIQLSQEFEQWIAHHGKQYHSHEEKQHRFRIWTQNHHRTIEKNRRHGPCKLTKQPVFGSNMFKDLSPEEFKAKYLTGYKGPTTDKLGASGPSMTPSKRRQLSPHHGKTLKPGEHTSKMHETIKQRKLQRDQQQQQVATMRNPNCKWYDVACFLRWLWNTAGIQFGAIVGTMEPKYDPGTYPNSVDWRDYGVVTDVRSQGDCGACWAVTAVETIESAHAIGTGKLYDLSEAEVITCDDSCEMCSGGWPQNAFEWVMAHGGLKLYNAYPYDANTLLAMTNGLEGTSYSWTADSVKAFREQTCPANGDDHKSSHDSEDGDWHDEGMTNENYADYSDQGRYGNIKGYGYATDRCICYSDGSGCACDNQDEELAIANIATYGPAVVCVEASLWQDYTGGIMTSEIGCGSEFLDMNHCVQVVGYAFTDGSDSDEEDEENGSQDHSGSQDRRNSQDSGTREGYWIVRNQWGGYWGYSGYAYVAMGDNTCGILNDMTQAYL